MTTIHSQKPLQQQQQQPRRISSTVPSPEHSMPDLGSQLLVKCVVVGDQGVGKSHLVCSRANGTKYTLRELVVQAHISSIWTVDQYRENHDVRMRSRCDIDGVSCAIRIWDTFGNHDKDRQFAYLHTDVVIICFSAASRRSLVNVEKFWIPEVRRMCGMVPIIVCGCQIDYRYLTSEPSYIKLDKGPFTRKVKMDDIVLPEEGRAVARKIGASYYETSVLAQYGIDDVFSNAVRACLFQKRRSQIFSKIGNLKHVTKPHLQVPHLPPKPLQPEFETPAPPPVGQLRPVRSRRDLQTYCDVTFIVDGGVRLYAHWVNLIAASPSFHRLYQCRHRPLDLSRSDFISLGSASTNSGSSSSRTSVETLTSWLPPWRRTGVRVRMSSRLRYMSQNLPMTSTKSSSTAADDALSVGDVPSDRYMADSSTDLITKSVSRLRPEYRRRQSIKSLDTGESDRYEDDALNRQSSEAASVLTLTPLDDDDDDDVDNDDDDNNVDDDDVKENDHNVLTVRDVGDDLDADRVTEYSDVDSGYTNPTSQATSVTCLPSTAFVGIETRGGKGGVVEESVITVVDGISVMTFEDVLHYVYTGKLPLHEDAADLNRSRYERLQQAARLIGMTDLVAATANVLRDEAFLNADLRCQVKTDRVQRIEQMFIEQGQLSDVVVELEDGAVPAHRALLMCRSDMMVSMFNLDFSERANKTVPFRSATVGGFRGLMHYLYTGQCPTKCDDWASLIEMADRLYLPQLLYAAQVNCVNHLNQMNAHISSSTDAVNDFTETVLGLIDAAKLHKVDQVERWCRWYLQVNFNEVIEKHFKTFEALHPDTQTAVAVKRWPPEWYMTEVDAYERALTLMTKDCSDASWLRRPNGEVHDPTHCFGFLRKKK